MWEFCGSYENEYLKNGKNKVNTYKIVNEMKQMYGNKEKYMREKS